MSSNGQWSALPQFVGSKDLQKLTRHNASYIHVGGSRIVVSGGIESQTLKRVIMVNLADGKVSTLPSMLNERSGHSSVFFRNSIFDAGGQISTRKKTFTTNSVEK